VIIDLEVKVLRGVGRNDRVNCKATIVRASLKDAGSETCGATNRNRIRGLDQGERAPDRDALVTKEPPR